MTEQYSTSSENGNRVTQLQTSLDVAIHLNLQAEHGVQGQKSSQEVNCNFGELAEIC